MQIMPQVRRHQQLASHREEIALTARVVATQPSFDNRFDCTKKFGDEDLQKRHPRRQDSGAFSLDMPESVKAAEHFNQQLSRLFRTTADSLSDLWQYLDLESTRRANHTDKAGHLYDAAPPALSKTQPRRTPCLGNSEALILKPVVDVARDAVRAHDLHAIRIRRKQRVEFIDRNAVHQCPGIQTNKFW